MSGNTFQRNTLLYIASFHAQVDTIGAWKLHLAVQWEFLANFRTLEHVILVGLIFQAQWPILPILYICIYIITYIHIIIIIYNHTIYIYIIHHIYIIIYICNMSVCLSVRLYVYTSERYGSSWTNERLPLDCGWVTDCSPNDVTLGSLEVVGHVKWERQKVPNNFEKRQFMWRNMTKSCSNNAKWEICK